MADRKKHIKSDDYLTRNYCQRGFTLLEVLIAIAILTIGILGVNAMQISSVKGNSIANQITEGTNSAADRMERIFAMPFDSGTNGLDDDSDGTVDELDEQFLDADGDDLAGINDSTAVTADGFLVSADGEYTIYWNVAMNQPDINMKTINIIVENISGFKKMRVTVSSIKTIL